MNLRLKNKKSLTIITFVSSFFLLVSSLFFVKTKSVWSEYDYKSLDFFYKQAVKHGYGPKASFTPQIIYLTITDTSYDFFEKNYLDRSDLAKVNNALSHLNTETVIYDIIFTRKSTLESDRKFTDSLLKLDSVSLPTALGLSEKPVQFKWVKDSGHDRFRSDCIYTLIEKGTSKPYYANRVLLQYKDFAKVATRSGDISVITDSDSVYRHIPLLIKVDDAYYPSLGLSIFLNWAKVSFENIIVKWGESILIPATKENNLEENVIIPIDQKGRVFVPFVNSMGNDFNTMTSHALIKYFSDENFRGNLLDFFEGNFVLISDVATGTSDLGSTPLETNTPLVTLHASLLNGLLTNTFYTPWSLSQVLSLTFLLCLLLITASLLKSPWFLYGAGFAFITGLIILTWSEFTRFHLFPVMTSGSVVFFVFFGLTITLEIVTSKDRAFIKNTFSKYVPKKVVTQLLNNPELIKLGGEERVASVLFSDIENFTNISEKLSPDVLVGLLNEYFKEMSEIVFQHGGIIDKYQGDSIMAEFGIPISTNDHADQAVLTALKMQDSLSELRNNWSKRGLPQLYCRVGINTNSMIVGNIGSPKIFDYTVIGDAVNLASRLEGASKRYGTSIIISHDTLDNLTPGRFKCRILDFIIVKGQTNPIKIYEVYGLQTTEHDSKPNLKNETYYHVYNNAFEDYLSGEFSSAKDGFLKALYLRNNDDKASQRLINRINKLTVGSIPDDWDGSVSLTVK